MALLQGTFKMADPIWRIPKKIRLDKKLQWMEIESDKYRMVDLRWLI